MRMKTTGVSLMAVTLLATMGAGVRAEGPTVSGFVDVGYNYNQNGQATNKYRSYDANANTITLQNAKIGIAGEMENTVGYNVELMYGYDASVTNATGFYTPVSSSTANSLEADISQAYLTYPCSITGAKFTLGKFVTPFGVEVIEAKDNYNISRGLLFGYAVPTNHTGLKADRGFSDGQLTTTIGIVNGWDNMNDNNSGKTAIAQIGTTLIPKTSIMLGGSYGAEQDVPTSTSVDQRSVNGNGRGLIDAIVKMAPTDSLTFIANADFGEEKFNDSSDLTSDKRTTGNWSGIGLHANFQITDAVSIAGRWESLDDDGTRTGSEQVLRSETVTLQTKKDSVIYRLEYRTDHSTYQNTDMSDDNYGNYAFKGKTGNYDRASQSTIGAQVILTF
jgi:hypothetical protein